MMIQTQMASGAPWPRTKFPPSEASYQAHVLAVDDSLVDRKVIETLFRISSCKVTAVDSGRRALQFLGLDDEDRSSGPGPGVDVDMIITDYCMPGMSGFELLKKIKESSAFREVPVVIMSSDNINTRIDRCLEEGAEDYIVKPVKLSDVRRIKGYMMMRDDGSNASDRGRDLSDASDLSSTWTPSMQSSASSYPSSLIPSSSMPPDSNPPSSPSVSSEPSLSNSSLPAPTQS